MGVHYSQSGYQEVDMSRISRSSPPLLASLLVAGIALSLATASALAGASAHSAPLPPDAQLNAAPPSVTAAAQSGASAPDDVAVTIDGSWAAFNWIGGGTPFASEGAFTFTAAATVKLKVTDAFCLGDRFRVFDFGVAVGETNEAGIGVGCTFAVGDPDIAFTGRFSRGTFVLGPGAHSITIQTIQNYFGSGTGYLRVDSDTAGGWVFLDEDQDGFRDAGETQGVGGAKLDIRRNDLFTDSNFSVAPAGFYQIWGGKRPGTYCVQLQLPAGYWATSPAQVCQSFPNGVQSPFTANFGLARGARLHMPLVLQPWR
jgi:hypothetical protein